MIIQNATVFTGEQMIERTNVRFEDGIIQEIGTDLTPKAGEKQWDAQGKVLAPGFIDIHIHGYAGRDSMEGEEAILEMASGMTRHGVTGFLPTTVSATIEETHFCVMGTKKAMARQHNGSKVLGCHMEAPFLNINKKGAQRGDTLLAPSLEDYKRMTEGCEDVVRVLTLAPELPGAQELMEALKGKVMLSIGHTEADCALASKAVDWGATQVTHIFNAMSPLHHREPGVVGTALSDDRLFVQLIADLIHLHPTAVKVVIAAKGADLVVLITDAMMATQMPDGQYELGGLPVYVKGGAARLVDGDNLAGSTLTMDAAVRNLILTLGIAPQAALTMASTTSAKSIGLDDKLGHIAPGYPADMVLLNDQWQVVSTFVDGREVYSAQ